MPSKISGSSCGASRNRNGCAELQGHSSSNDGPLPPPAHARTSTPKSQSPETSFLASAEPQLGHRAVTAAAPNGTSRRREKKHPNTAPTADPVATPNAVGPPA